MVAAWSYYGRGNIMFRERQISETTFKKILYDAGAGSAFLFDVFHG